MKSTMVIFALLIVFTKGQAMDKEWFQTWDRPEYLEWAKEIPDGYLLHIIRQEKENCLVVQARLIMGEEGLPRFEVIKQHKAADREDALEQLQIWEEVMFY